MDKAAGEQYDSDNGLYAVDAGSWYVVDASQQAVANWREVQGSKLQRAIDEEVRRLTNG